jgi:transcription elongation factor Elf1
MVRPGKWRDENVEKIRQYRRDWYKRNKARSIKASRARKRKIQKWIKDYKATMSCNRCGEANVACLDFHHVDPSTKIMNIANVARNGWGLERIKAEIAKCIILCCNCHRKMHD